MFWLKFSFGYQIGIYTIVDDKPLIAFGRIDKKFSFFFIQKMKWKQKLNQNERERKNGIHRHTHQLIQKNKTCITSRKQRLSTDKVWAKCTHEFITQNNEKITSFVYLPHMNFSPFFCNRKLSAQCLKFEWNKWKKWLKHNIGIRRKKANVYQINRLLASIECGKCNAFIVAKTDKESSP